MEAKEGSRVKVVRFVIGPSGWDDNQTVPPGTEGTVTSMSDRLGPAAERRSKVLRGRQIWVAWDNGAHLALLDGEDEYEVLS